MCKEREAKILFGVIALKGAAHQKAKLIEEMSELTFEVARDLQGRLDYKKAIDEIADVKMMLKQYQNLLGENAAEDVKKRYKYKIDRLETRIIEKTL